MSDAVEVGRRRQKRMGPAPFASFEDLSDEVRINLESPEDKSNSVGSVVRLPGIREDITPMTEQQPPIPTTTTISTMSHLSAITPRIDISRASSSSHQEDDEDDENINYDGTQHRKDDEAEESNIPNTTKCNIHDSNDVGQTKQLCLGYREDGTNDLRSSTEELLQDYNRSTIDNLNKVNRAPSPISINNHQRKDSQTSDIVLLSISGRTSRLSSIGSQGSAQSGSHLSNASHLSVVSGVSGGRSPSPHKMLLETSFCGPKPPGSATVSTSSNNLESLNNLETDEGENIRVMEKTLLARRSDPTQVVLAEGISVDDIKTEKSIKKIKSTQQVANEIKKSSITIKVEEPPITNNNNDTKTISSRIVSNSGVEYIYIPLKGPLPCDLPQRGGATESVKVSKPRVIIRRQTKFNNGGNGSNDSGVKVGKKPPPCSTSIQGGKKSSVIINETSMIETTPMKDSVNSEFIEPKYIRIKLKPDWQYSQEKVGTTSQPTTLELQKPDCLDLRPVNEIQQHKINTFIESATKTVPSNMIRRPLTAPSVVGSASGGVNTTNTGGGTGLVVDTSSKSPSPSPSLSRKSSFASIFRSKQQQQDIVTSPESPVSLGNGSTGSGRRKIKISGLLRDTSESLRERSRSRSKSRERHGSLSGAPSSTESIDSVKAKHKSSVFAIFKSNNSSKSKQQQNEELNIQSRTETTDLTVAKEPKIDIQFKDDISMVSDSIRIPLHSPTHYHELEKGIISRDILLELKTSSQDSQETVIEASVSKAINKPEAIEELSSIPQLQAAVDSQLTEGGNEEEEEKEKITDESGSVFSTRLGSRDKLLFTTNLPIDVQVVIKEPELETNAFEDCVEKIEDNEDAVTVSSTRSSLFSTKKDKVHHSSESEPDSSEIEFVRRRQNAKPPTSLSSSQNNLHYDQPERKVLVVKQDESYEDQEEEEELPYVPTTLPLERSAAIPIMPVKDRAQYRHHYHQYYNPIERPRSTTPINPSCLEEYCEEVAAAAAAANAACENFDVAGFVDKLRISLPGHEVVAVSEMSSSPRQLRSGNWFEFAEKQQSSTKSNPPPQQDNVVSKGSVVVPNRQNNWINFEEIPEKRRPPKRIQTLPTRGNKQHVDDTGITTTTLMMQENNNVVVYNYVNPDECKCECHEVNLTSNTHHRSGGKESKKKQRSSKERYSTTVAHKTGASSSSCVIVGSSLKQVDHHHLQQKSFAPNVEIMEDEQPLLHGKLSVVDKSTRIESKIQRVNEPSVDLEKNVERNDSTSLRTPFTSDLGISSNRSSIISQEDSQSPDSVSPNAFPENF